MEPAAIIDFFVYLILDQEECYSLMISLPTAFHHPFKATVIHLQILR